MKKDVFDDNFTIKAGGLFGVTHGYADYVSTGVSAIDGFADKTGLLPLAALEASICHNNTGACVVVNAMPTSLNSDPYRFNDINGDVHEIEAPKAVVGLSFSVPIQ